MRKLLNITLVFIATSLFTSCFYLYRTAHTTYSIRVINQSRYPLILDFKTIDSEEVFTLTNDPLNEGIARNIHATTFWDELKDKYSDDEFNAKLERVLISRITPDGDTIPVSQSFADREYWEYYESEDDEIIFHNYHLYLTDELVE